MAVSFNAGSEIVAGLDLTPGIFEITSHFGVDSYTGCEASGLHVSTFLYNYLESILTLT